MFPSLTSRAFLRWCLPPCLALAAGCSKKENSAASARGPRGAVPVIVEKAARRDVPLFLPSIGTVQPRASVIVRPQIGGELAAVHCKEGDFVKAGDPLFSIDPRPFEVALAEADAAVAQAKAELANADAQAGRYTRLDKGGSVSKELVEQFTTAAVTARAKVTAAEAALQSAKLKLDYCSIAAPLGGRLGRLLVDPGNIILPSVTDLAVINEISPAEVSFTLAGRHLPALRAQLQGEPLLVTAVPEGATAAEQGTLAFIDNAVKPGTGTIEIRSLFPNEKQTLWPGQFVDVRLRLTETKNAVTVPSKAVQTGQTGPYVYVITGEKTANLRNVKTDRSHEGATIILEGVSEGDLVVVDGHSLLSPGSKVDIRTGLEAVPAKGGKPDGKLTSNARP